MAMTHFSETHNNLFLNFFLRTRPNHSHRREGRSSANVRISASVNPQARSAPNLSIGRRVMITSGQYVGSIGEF